MLSNEHNINNNCSLPTGIKDFESEVLEKEFF